MIADPHLASPNPKLRLDRTIPETKLNPVNNVATRLRNVLKGVGRGVSPCLMLIAGLTLCIASCSKSDSPNLETKRLVVKCVQEPAVVLQAYYSKPQRESSVLDRAPVDRMIETAKRNRQRDLEQLSPQHRTLVEARMVEIAHWMDTNTVVTATRPAGAPSTGLTGTLSEIKLPSAKEFNEKAKALCVEVFCEW